LHQKPNLSGYKHTKGIPALLALNKVDPGGDHILDREERGLLLPLIKKEQNHRKIVHLCGGTPERKIGRKGALS